MRLLIVKLLCFSLKEILRVGCIILRGSYKLNANLGKCHLDNEYRLYHFIAQIFQEIGLRFAISESFNYSPIGLITTFGYYKKHLKEAYRDGRTSNHLAKQIIIANKVYSNRNGNYDIASGDGWRYRGRGLKQLTGRENYQAFTKFSHRTWQENVDFEATPDLLTSSMKYATRSALYFWSHHKLYLIADHGFNRKTSDKITYIVNKYTSSYEQRYNNLIDFSSKKIFHTVFN